MVRQRLKEIPPIRFFTDEEARRLVAIIERILPQPDRNECQKIPILPWIDEKLFEDKRDGYRYEGMPPQREAWRVGLEGINETARALFAGREFIDLDPVSQDVVLTHVAEATLLATPGPSYRPNASSATYFARPSLRLSRTSAGLECDWLQRTILAARPCP